MSRDYKPNRHSSRDREPASGGGAFKGILYGLVLGLVIAAAVAWWFNRMPSPFIDKMTTATGPAKGDAKAPAPAAAASAPATTPAPAVNVQSEDGKPIPLPGKPGDPSPEKRFQFPDILSGKTDGTTPTTKPGDTTVSKPATAAPAPTPEPAAGFYLMAGSFQKQSDAETQKANLALQGFDASIQKAVIGEKVWFRVKIGPFKRQDDANRARNELKEAGIDAVPARN